MQNFKQFTLGFLIFHFLLMFQTVGQSDTITRQVTYRDSIALADTGTIVDWKGDLPSDASPFRAHFEVQIETPRIETEIHALAILDRENDTLRVEPRWARNEICDQFVGKFSTRGGVRLGGWLVFDLTSLPFFDGVYYELELSALNPLLPVEFPENIDRLWDEAEYFASLPGGEDEITLTPEFPDLMPAIELSGADIADLVVAYITAGTTKAADAALVAANTVLDEEDKKRGGAVRTLIETILANAGFEINGGLGCELKLSDVGLDIERSTVKGDKMIAHTRCDGTLSAQFYLTFSADFSAEANPLGVKLWEKKAKIADQQFDVGPQFEFDSLDFIAAPNPVEFPTKTAADDFTQWDLPGGATARFGKGATFDMDYSPNGDLIAVGTSTGAWLYDAESGEEVALLRSGEKVSSVTDVCFSGDGKTLATTIEHGSVILWDVATKTQKPGIVAYGRVKSFNHDGTLMATIGGGKIYVWDVATGTEKYRFGSNVTNASFSPDLRTLAVTHNWRRRVSLWNVTTGDHIATLPEVTSFRSTSFSPNGETLASGGDDGKIYLWDVAEQTVTKVLLGHSDPDLVGTSNDYVLSVSFSPDGKTLASGGMDRTVRLWDVDSGGQISIFTGHIGHGDRVSFGRDSKTLASISYQDGSVYMWDLATRLPKFTISGYFGVQASDERQGAIFSPDGKTLASIGSDDGAIHLWDVATGRPRAALNGCLEVGDHILSASFSPDGKTLASGGSDSMMRLWDVASGREIAALKHDSDVSSVSFSPDGKTLASRSGSEVRLWDVHTWTEKSVLSHRSGPQSVSFSPDSLTLASTVRSDNEVHSNRDVHLWDVDTGKPIGALTGHTKNVWSAKFSPDRDSGILASVGSDGTVLMWNVDSRSVRATLSGYNVSFSPDGKTLATADYDADSRPVAVVRLWDVPTGTEIGTLGHSDYVSNAIFSPDGKALACVAVGRSDSKVVLWDVEERREIAVHNYMGRNYISISFSPDSKTLASMGYDFGTVYLWDVATGKKKNVTFTRHTGNVYSASFSPDSQTLASAGGNDGTVRLWDVPTRTEIGALSGHIGDVRSVSFSPDRDSNMLASADDSKVVRLWDVGDRTQIAEFTGHTGHVRSVIFSPNGERLASVGGYPFGDEARLWNVEKEQEIATLAGHTTGANWEVISVSFSPDSETLAGACTDNMVRLWDADSGAEIDAIPGPPRNLYRVIFSPDGNVLAATGSETPDAGKSAEVVYLWYAANLTEPAVIKIHDALYGNPTLSFSPDSRTLAYAAVDSSGTVRLWDIAAGKEKPGFSGNYFDVNSVRFSPNGKTLVTAYDHGVRLWDVATRAPKVSIRANDPDIAIFSPDGGTLVAFAQGSDRMFWLNVPASGSAEEGTRLAADVNGDGAVNIQDLVAVSAALGQTGENDADINGDGAVNIQDMVAVAAALLEAAAAPSLIQAQPAAGLTAAEVAHWIAAAQSANLTDATSQRGIRFLHYLLAMLTPQETALLPNYPNPFNPETWMPYRLAAPGEVTLTIRAVDGGIVRALALGHQPAGVYQAKSRAAYWDGRNSRGEAVASGVYFYTLSAGDFSATRKMLIRK